MPSTSKKLGGLITLDLSVHQAFETSHIVGTM